MNESDPGSKRILDSAAYILRTKGLGAARLSEIAKRAGMLAPSIYHHFKSKSDVANAVIELQYEIAQAYAERALTLGRTALERMMWVSQSFAQQMKDEVVVSAGVRLTTEADASELAREAPYGGWIAAVEQLIVMAV